MKKLLQLVVLVLLALMVLTAVFVKFMGWTGLLVLLALMVLGVLYIKSRAAKLLEKALVTPFVIKGAVLKGATAEVHHVEPASRPSRTYVQHYNEDDDEEADEIEVEDEGSNEYNRHFIIDATITPQATDGPFQYWEPTELVLVKVGTVSGELDTESAEVGQVFEVARWNEGEWIEDEGEKYPGPQRVRLLVGVQEGVRSCHFRYYFEVFGQVELVEPVV